MIQKRTVFVLGAGASMPYGFPSGPSLRHEICTQALTPDDPRHKILVQIFHSKEKIKACRTALSRSWASSIDMFIASRSDYADIAKAAVALTIAKCETDNDLFFAKPKEDWFRYLWRFLYTPNGELLPTDRVSFVTFNYDRTLEHSLANGLKHAGRVDTLTSDMLPKIVHVYGSLGPYPFFPGEADNREFGAQSTVNNISQSKQTINVPSEKDQSSLYPKQAQDLLEKAEQVIFLGFGYDEDNLRVLRLLKDDSCLHDDCDVYGTRLGFSSEEHNWVLGLFGRCGTAGYITLTDENVNCLMFLRQHQDLFV